MTDSIEIIDTLLADINWLSKCSDENKQNWTNVKADEILLNSIKYFRKKNSLLTIYQALINILDDKQIESRKEMPACVDLFLDYFRRGSDWLLKGICVVKESELYIDNAVVREKLHLIRVESGYNTLAGILQSLYRLAINGTMRFRMYESDNFKGHAKMYLFKGKLLEH